jgi:hypothetical protein
MPNTMVHSPLRALSLTEALACYGQLRLPLCPATLSPAYVAADASRNPALTPVHLHYQSQSAHWLHSLHLTDIAGSAWRDASSPYGYGGPLCTSDDPGFVAQAWDAYSAWMREQAVVVEYVRFHPLLANQRYYGGAVAPNREVVWVDLQVPDLLASYAPRLRSTVSKATRAGLVYSESPLAPHVAAFAAYYRAAMQAMGADPFFWFDDRYFEQLAGTGLARLGLCRKAGEAPWLAASLLLDGVGVSEYHLAASCDAGRRSGAASFSLHQAALAARQRGLDRLYLGGGSDTATDNPLLFFKAGFSAQRLTYHTGSHVFDSTRYAALQDLFPQAWAAHPERPIFYRKV